MSYFQVPSDLKELSRCYRWGDDCEEDNVLANKLLKKAKTKQEL